MNNTKTYNPLFTADKVNSARMETLGSEIATLVEELKQNVTAETVRLLREKREELDDLEARQRKEYLLKEAHRRKFLKRGVGTPSDFERLWITRLRDEALLEELDEATGLRGARSHSIYEKF